MEELFTDYIRFLEQVLKPNRLKHSLGVMQVMGELAGIYGLDRVTAQMTGLLHDAAKDLPPVQYQQLVQEAGIPLRYPCEQDYMLYLHGPVGAFYLYRELGGIDPQILYAVYTHCWTEPSESTRDWMGDEGDFHAPLAWCLRFADLLEPGRDWSQSPTLRQGVPLLREAVYAGHMQQAARFQAQMIRDFFGEKGFPVHPKYEEVLSSQFSVVSCQF